MAADAQMVGAKVVGQTELVKYSKFSLCVFLSLSLSWTPCLCVFGCEAQPDAVLGHALRRIKGLAL